MIDLSITAVKIANARKEKGFTQEELAVRLGVSSQAVSKWERALSLPDIELLIDLSQILDVSLENLLINDSSFNTPVNTTVYDISKCSLIEQSLNDQIIIISFGVGLIPIFTREYLARFTGIRTGILQDTGVLIPTIRIMDNSELPEYKCVLTLFGAEAWSRDYTDAAETVQTDIVDNTYSIVTGRLSEFVNRHMVKLLVENVRIGMPFVVDGVIPERIDLSTLRTLLKKLVNKGISIRNLVKIIETLDEMIDDVKDRQALEDALLAKLSVT